MKKRTLPSYSYRKTPRRVSIEVAMAKEHLERVYPDYFEGTQRQDPAYRALEACVDSSYVVPQLPDQKGVCVFAVHAAITALERVGMMARPLNVWVEVSALPARNPEVVIGVTPEIMASESRTPEETWPGHLLVKLGRWAADLTSGQFTSPRDHIAAPRSLVFPAPTLDFPIEVLAQGRARLRYTVRDDTSWAARYKHVAIAMDPESTTGLAAHIEERLAKPGRERN